MVRQHRLPFRRAMSRVQLLYTVQRSRVLHTVTSECICVRLKFQQRPGTPIFCGKMMSELYV
jgi:hypothetical protein